MTRRSASRLEIAALPMSDVSWGVPSQQQIFDGHASSQGCSSAGHCWLEVTSDLVFHLFDLGFDSAECIRQAAGARLQYTDGGSSDSLCLQACGHDQFCY